MSSPPAIAYDTIYHIYNRGIARANIFLTERDYDHFLALLERYILPVAEIYAYNLLRNHFHLGVRIKSEQEIAATSIRGRVLVPSLQFSHCFNTYAKVFNARYGRTGSLFQHPFGRRAVLTEEYFRRLIVYIHRNPQTHGLIDDFRQWKYSSYGALMSEPLTSPAHEAVRRVFGTLRALQEAHAEPDTQLELEWLGTEDFLE